MSKETFLKLLNSQPDAVQMRPGWITAPCPLAPWMHDKGVDNHPSFGVRDKAGDAFCHCFSCGFSGDQSDLVFEMRDQNKKQHVRVFRFGDALALIDDDDLTLEGIELNSPDIEECLWGKKKPTHIFPEYMITSFAPAIQIPWALDYLRARDVPVSLIQELNIRADTDQRRVCFPVIDFQGRLRGLHGRAVDKGVEPRYRMYRHDNKLNPDVWLGEEWVDLEKPIVVVEGPFDVLSVKRVYANVVTPLSSSVNKRKVLRMSDAFEWVTFFDRGAAGDNARLKVEGMLEDHLVTHVQPPVGVDDPGEMSVEDVFNTLKGLLNLTPA